MVQKEQQKIVEELLKIISENNCKKDTIVPIVSDFIFSIGFSLEGSPKINSSHEVEIRYGENPTLGNALMAQAIWMKETWVVPNEERKTNGNKHVRKSTKNRKDN